MTQTALVLVPAWLLLTALGWILTGLLPDPARSGLRPASPVIGLALPVLVLHWTTLVTGVDTGVWVVLGVAVVLAVIATVRDRRWWAAGRRVLLTTVAVGAVAAVPAVIALAPTLAVGDSRLVQPSGNNDAYYYITVSDWLIEHPATDVPTLADDPAANDDPPSYNSARAQLQQHLRIGQELTQSAIAVTLHQPVDDVWWPLTCLWIFLLPAAGYGIAYLWSMRRLVGVALGLAIAVASVTVNQLAYQNSDSLLGYTVVPFAVAAVVSVLGAHRPVPRWLAGVLFVTGVGIYTEFLTLVALPLVVATIIRRPRAVPTAVRSAVIVLLVAGVAGPFIWYRAVKSLLFLGGIPTDNYPNQFGFSESGLALNRFVGAATPTQTFVASTATPVLVTALVVGAVAALLFSRRRPFLFALLVVPPAITYYLAYLAPMPRPYTEQRIVQLFLPLLLLVAAFGWDRLMTVAARRRNRPRSEQPEDDAGAEPTEPTGAGHAGDRGPGRRRPAAATAGVAVLAVLALAAWGLTNARTSHRQGLVEQARVRNVDPTFAQAAGWVERVGGHDGEDVDVLAADFFNQLWITDALRGETEVAYPRLYRSYQGVAQYWNGTPRRYLLIDSATLSTSDPGVVVERNARFSLLDLARGRAAALVPADEFSTGSWFLLRAGGASPPAVTVIGATGPAAARTAPPLPEDAGTALPASTLVTRPTAIALPVPGPADDLYSFDQDGLEFTPEEITLAPAS